MNTQQNTEADNFIGSLGHLPKEQRFGKWQEWSKNKPMDPNFKWEKSEELYTGADFRGSVTKDIDRELKVQRNNEGRYGFFQRELSNWPTWLQDKYKNQAANSVPYKKQVELSQARMNNKLDTRNAMKTFAESLTGLDGNKSAAAHGLDLKRAMAADYTPDQIKVDKDGHISVPHEGEMRAMYSIPIEALPQISSMEQAIIRRDIDPMIEETIGPLVARAQQDLKAGDRTRDRMLFDRLGKDPTRDLQEFEMDIIYTAASNELDPDPTYIEGLNKLYERDKSTFLSPFDAVASRIQNTAKLEGLIKRRNLDA